MLVFVDGMSHYDDALLTKKWDVRATDAVDPGIIEQDRTGGRYGAGRIIFGEWGAISNPSTRPAYIQKNYDGVETIICGLAFKQSTTQNGVGANLLTFLDGNTVQVILRVMPSGQIQAARSQFASSGIYLSQPAEAASGVPTYRWYPLGLSTQAISSSSYDFLEAKIVHHPTAGSIQMRRNGATFWTLNNVNTAISGNNNSSSVLVGGYRISTFTAFTGVSNHYNLLGEIGDFYLLNTTVNPSDAFDPVDFIGDRHWETVLPTVDRTYTDWTPDPVGDHYLNVDTVPPNVARNNSTAAIGNKDSFTYQPFTGPGTGNVLLAYTMYLEKDTGGAVGVSGLMRSPDGVTGTDGNGTEFQVPNPIAFRQSFLCTDPATSTAITVTAANAGEHGYERTS